MPSLRSRLEALLFVAAEPTTDKQLCVATLALAHEVRAALEELRGAGGERGFVLREVGGGWLLSSHPDCRDDVERFLLPPKTFLSQASLETLAIVAYLQPVTRAEIESLRGVNVDGVMNTLQQRQFIQEIGRKDGIGRPILYGTTDFFLQAFGLQSIAGLPPLPEGAPTRIAGSVVPLPLALAQ